MTHNLGLPYSFALVVFALGVRGAYLLSVLSSYSYQKLITNPLLYDEWARAVVAGSSDKMPPFYMSPGYPYWLGAMYSLGASREAAAVVQIVASAFTCLFVAHATCALWGRRAGLVAGCAACFYGPYIYFSVELLPETLSLFLIALATSITVVAPHDSPADMRLAGGLRWFLSGSLWMLLLTVRSVALVAIPFVLLDALLRGGRRQTAFLALPIGLGLCASLSVNYGRCGELSLLTTGGGANLFLGNNPSADGSSPFDTRYTESVYRALSSQAHQLRAERKDCGPPTAELIESDLLTEQVIAFWRTQPKQGLQLLWKKFVWTWTDRELPNNADIRWKSRQSWLFRLPGFPFSFGMILPLAAAGVALLGNRVAWSILMPPFVLGIGTATMFFTNARFRLPMTVPMLFLTGYAIAEGPRAFISLSTRRRVAILAVCIGAAFVAWGNHLGVREYRNATIDRNTRRMIHEARRSGQTLLQ